MEKRFLGQTGIKVSRLCYGTLSLSCSQADLSAQEGGELIAYAAASGVDFVDTAELYGTYAHLRYALRHTSIPLTISTKSYAYDRSGAQASVEKARRELDVDVIDLFMLHEQESVMTLLGHQEALDFYLSMKEKGVIRAVGISTHAIAPVQAVAQAKHMAQGVGQGDGSSVLRQGDGSSVLSSACPNLDRPSPFSASCHKTEEPSPCLEPSPTDIPFHWGEFDPGRYREIDVVHPILNRAGIGLLDGTSAQMQAAVEAAHQAGVGIFGMKMLGGGNLFNEFDEAVAYALSLDAADAFAVGMQSKDEIDMNIALFERQEVTAEQIRRTKARKRTLRIEDWCTGCGSCVKECKAGALRIVDGKAVSDPDRCVLCSYCARACRDFAIKVI